MKKLILHLSVVALALAAIYLSAVNLLLSRPETRAYLNGLAPERLLIGWQGAWSWYPLRIEVSGLHLDGQTPREQWQVEAATAAASLALIPLLQGRIRVQDIDLRDIDLRLRPRPTTGVDAPESRGHWPSIANRDPDAPAEQTPETADRPDAGLLLAIEDFRVRGSHGFWVSGIRGKVSGSVAGSFELDTRTGQIALTDGTLDLALDALSIRDVSDSTSGARIKGRVDIPPIIASRLFDAGALKRIEIDAGVDWPVNNLDFIEPLVGDLGDIALGGKGRVRGRLHQSGGELLADTDLVVEASELTLDLPPYAFNGDGVVELKVASSEGDSNDLRVRFNAVNGTWRTHPNQGPQTLFSGRNLEAVLRILNITSPDDSDASEPYQRIRIGVTIPQVSVPDLALYDQLIPDSSGLELLGGQGSMSARVAIAPGLLEMALDLASDDANVRFDDHRGTSDLGFSLRARGTSDAQATLDISGTRLRLDDTRLTSTDPDAGAGGDAAPWSAVLDIATGTLHIPLPKAPDGVDPLTQLAGSMAQHGIGPLLDTADGALDAELRVSSLDWIAGLLGRPLGLTLDGQGAIGTRLTLTRGRPASGTRLEIRPEGLALGILDHVISGKGRAILSVEDDDSKPGLRLQVTLNDAAMRRNDEATASVEAVALNADILVAAPVDDAEGTARVDLSIPSARITDMRVFNAYLPPNTPVAIASGQADLIGELHTDRDKVQGELLLTAEAVALDLDGIAFSGDLRLGVLIGGGAPEEMRFEVSGSSLSLDHFDVSGETASHDGADWSARVQLGETEVVWRKPMALEMKATLTIKDTRPFVAMLANARGEHHWIDDLLTLEDLAGHLRLDIDDEGAVIHEALFGDDKATIRAKGLSRTDHREALLLVRLKGVTGALELQDGKRQFSILGARKRFDAYVPGKTALPGRGIDISPKEEATQTETAVGPPRSDRPPADVEKPKDLFLDAEL